MIRWVLYRVIILLILCSSLIELLLAYGQNQTDEALVVVVNSPARFAMRDVLLIDINTGVQYTLWRQQNVYRIAISPNNQQVAMALFSNGGLTSFSMRSMNGTEPINRIHDGLSNPVWSPDGKYLVHTGSDFRHEGLYLTNYSGENLRLLLQANLEGVPVWSPNGRGLAFVSNTSAEHQLQYLEIETGSITHLVTSAEYILEIDWTEQLTIRTETQILTVEVDSQSYEIQEEFHRNSFGTAYNDRWSPQSDALAFTSGRRSREVIVADLSTQTTRHFAIDGLWVVSVDWWSPER